MKADRIILAGLAVALLPLFLLAAFNHPTDDDFCTYQLFRDSSPLQALQYGYQSFTGRYTYLLITAHWDPLYAQNWLTMTRLWPVITLLIFFLVIRASVGQLFETHAKRDTWLITSVLTVTMLAGWPSIASSFYWFTGATVYTLPLCAAVLALLSLNASFFHSGWKAAVMLVTATLLALMATGSNEVLITFLLVFTAGMIIIRLVRKASIPISLWLFMAVVIAGGLVALAAPGNFKRAGDQLHRSADLSYAAYALAKSLYLVALKTGSWLSSLPLWIGTILIAVWTGHTGLPMAGLRNVKEAGWSVVFVFLGMAGMAILSAYAYNDVIPRVYNLIYFVFVIAFVYLMVSALRGFPVFAPLLALVKNNTAQASFLFVLVCLLSANNNFTVAWNDLVFKAGEYDQRLQERYEVLKQARLKNESRVRIEPLFVETYRYPSSLFLNDLGVEADKFPNNCESYFFGIDSIELAGRPVDSRHLGN